MESLSLGGRLRRSPGIVANRWAHKSLRSPLKSFAVCNVVNNVHTVYITRASTSKFPPDVLHSDSGLSIKCNPLNITTEHN